MGMDSLVGAEGRERGRPGAEGRGRQPRERALAGGAGRAADGGQPLESMRCSSMPFMMASERLPTLSLR